MSSIRDSVCPFSHSLVFTIVHLTPLHNSLSLPHKILTVSFAPFWRNSDTEERTIADAALLPSTPFAAAAADAAALVRASWTPRQPPLDANFAFYAQPTRQSSRSYAPEPGKPRILRRRKSSPASTITSHHFAWTSVHSLGHISSSYS